MENTIKGKVKIKYVLLAPFMYLFFYILSFVEYIALIKSLAYLPTLKKSISQNKCDWAHVDRLSTKQT